MLLLLSGRVISESFKGLVLFCPSASKCQVIFSERSSMTTLSKPHSQLFSITLSALEVFPTEPKKIFAIRIPNKGFTSKYINNSLNQEDRQPTRKMGKRLRRLSKRRYPKMVNKHKKWCSISQKGMPMKTMRLRTCSAERRL